MGYRFTPPGTLQQPKPVKILQLYSLDGKKLKTPKIMKYTRTKAHDLTYNSFRGAKTYVVLWERIKKGDIRGRIRKHPRPPLPPHLPADLFRK